MKKKILYVGNFNLPYGTAAAQRVKENKKILEELNFEVIFISTYEKNYKSNETDININGISKNSFLLNVEYLKKNILQIGIENVYAVIFYNFPSIALLKSFNYLKNKKIKVYSDCTEWYGIPPNTKFIHKIIKTIDTEFRMRYVNLKIDGIICISSYLQDYYKGKNKKTVLIPNVIDLSDAKWEKKSRISSGKKIKFVYAGNPGENFEKENLDMILHFFNSLTVDFPEITLDIVGITEDFFKNIYHKRYNCEPNLKNVVFLGRKTHLQVIEKVKMSDYFIFFRPHTKANVAGFPTKLVESFGAGTPVITNDLGDVSMYVKNGINGYILNTENIDQSQKKLKEIIKEHPFSNNLSKEILESNPFDYKKYRSKLNEFI